MHAAVTTAEIDVDRKSWRNLYTLARQVAELQPWTWMLESDVFAVELPETHRVVFVSVMGARGEHIAVAVYPDNAAITAFWELQINGEARAEQVLELPQIQLSLESRDQLQPEDRKIAKDLGLTFRGKNAWPLFRSYQPGFFPWFIEGDEAAMLTVALEQLLQVAPRIRIDRNSFLHDDLESYLVRVRNQAGEWADEFRKIPRNPSTPAHVPLNPADIRQCRALPGVENRVEVDLFMMPTPIQDDGLRPYFPYMLALAEAESGAIVGQEMLMPIEAIDGKVWAMLPEKFLNQLKQIGVLPAALVVRSGRVEKFLRPVAQALGIQLRARRRLPKLDVIKTELVEMLSRNRL
jgi:hypothetical protein